MKQIYDTDQSLEISDVFDIHEEFQKWTKTMYKGNESARKKWLALSLMSNYQGFSKHIVRKYQMYLSDHLYKGKSCLENPNEEKKVSENQKSQN